MTGGGGPTVTGGRETNGDWGRETNGDWGRETNGDWGRVEREWTGGETAFSASRSSGYETVVILEELLLDVIEGLVGF